MRESPGRNRRGGAAAGGEWLLVALLAGIAGALTGQVVLPDRADGQTFALPETRPGEDVFAVAGQVSKDTYGLYLVDLRNGTICLYEYVGGERRLYLRAARTFHYDRQLDAYNTEPPPAEIRKKVSEATRLKDARTQPSP
jgi:hypothetical protein